MQKVFRVKTGIPFCFYAAGNCIFATKVQLIKKTRIV